MNINNTKVAEVAEIKAQIAEIEEEIAELEAIEKMVEVVFQQLKAQEIHPEGRFVRNGCWYTKQNSDLISVREPSRNHPYSENRACRSKKYVMKVCKKYNCTTVEQLQNSV